METIAYIGLGIMGRPMALNLIRAGYSVRVWARRSEMMQPLIEAGATACSSPADAAGGADIIITNVSDTADVEQVVLGTSGVIEGASAGSVVVDMSTISPSVPGAMFVKRTVRPSALFAAYFVEGSLASSNSGSPLLSEPGVLAFEKASAPEIVAQAALCHS